MDPVTSSAQSAITTITSMLQTIASAQSKMESLDVQIHPQHRSAPARPRRREQIIGESLSSDLDSMPVVPKGESTRRVITAALKTHFLFSDLEESGTVDVIDAMVPEESLAGMVIIQQGEAGDKFYVLESGRAQIKVDGRVMGSVSAGEAFGELALMWNSPRAATVVAVEDCVLWTLSRPLFRRLLATSSSSQTAVLCDFLKNVPLLKPLGNQETTKIARALRAAMYSDGEYIIRQGEEGDAFYLIYKGEVVCTRSDEDGHERELIKLGAGDFFGERALQMKEPRAANVIARGDVECFTLSQVQFNLLLGSIHDVIYHITTARVLKSVPLLSALTDEALYMLTNMFKHQKMTKGEFVIQEGSEGDHFYVVHDGSVLVTQWSSSLKAQVELDILGSGQYFGEIALVTRARRTASVVVVSEKAELLVMHRDDFHTFMAPFEQQIQEQMEMRENAAIEKHGMAESSAVGFGATDDAVRWLQSDRDGHPRTRTESLELVTKQQRELQQVVLEDLEIVCTLGTGTFGRVVMVSHRLTGEVNALKCLQKAHLIRTQQQQNVRNERTAMQCMSHPFIVELLGTLSDSNQVYFLLEYVPGGELWSLLYEKKDLLGDGPWGGMSLRSAMLFAAMCVSAFEHIHSWGFCYRDLKPENLLVAANGYLKLADFGFSKKLPYKSSLGKSEDRTFTLCGTPEYMAPEIVLSRGHDKGVDFWAVGILVYEMLCGTTPFESSSQQETFERIVYSQRYLRFPLGFDPHAKSLVRKLLESNSALRLGALKGGVEDIKEHLFFSAHDLDWGSLTRGEIKMDYTPDLTGPMDASHFDNGDGDQDLVEGLEMGSGVEEFVVGDGMDLFSDF